MRYSDWIESSIAATVSQFVYSVDWRAYWILAPGALILGFAGQPIPILIAVVFASILRALCLISWREVVLLAALVAAGWCTGNTVVNEVRTVDGVVSLVSGNCMYITGADGKVLKVFTNDPQLPGSCIKARVGVQYTPLHPGDCTTTPTLKLVRYLEIKDGQVGLRQKIHDALNEHLSQEAAGIAGLLILGAGSISDDLRRSFVDAGLSHVLAISGLHVSIVCGTAWWLLRRIFALTTTRILEPIAFGVSVCIGLAYAVIAGCGIPLLRALSMFCIGGVAWCVGRSVDLARLCGFVACVMLCAYPDQWYAPSFALSFLATASLITKPRSLFIVSLPYTLHFFFQSSMQPFLANFLAISWLSIAVMPCLLCALALWCVGSSHLFALADLALQVLAMIARHPLSYTLHVGYQETIWIVLWTFSVFAFFLVQRYYALGPGLVCVLIGLLRAGPHEPVALRYGSTVGLWDNEVLWVSDKNAWVVRRWQDILGGVSVREICECDSDLWVTDADGYLWTNGKESAWLGVTAKCPEIASQALVKLVRQGKNYQCLGARNCFDGDALWVWIGLQKAWKYKTSTQPSRHANPKE